MSEGNRWWERLNRGLLPFMGPAQVGPYDTPPAPTASICPLCGQPMERHVIERSSTAPTRLHCPPAAAA
ncbi:MAG TPA: hypothetical protein VN200_06535 [Rhodoglobus sp.]|nr:hypothetical protein [Rhodoglobus sp.]